MVPISITGQEGGTSDTEGKGGVDPKMKGKRGWGGGDDRRREGEAGEEEEE